MRPAPFRYLAPRSLEEALEALARHGAEAKVFAGGQSLVPMMNMRLARTGVVIDINRIPGLDAIAGDDGGIRLGALVRQRRLEQDRLVAARAPLLAEAAPHIGHVQTRARGTIGGSVAHADPAAELPACAVALDVVTFADLGDAGRPLPIVPVEPALRARNFTALAAARVRYAGEAIAAVVAESRYAAEDARELVEVEYQVLPSVQDPLGPGDARVHDDVDDNVAGRLRFGHGDVDAALACAPTSSGSGSRRGGAGASRWRRGGSSRSTRRGS